MRRELRGDWWGGPLVLGSPLGTEATVPLPNDVISILQDASRPTGASAADRGVRPTTRTVLPIALSFS